MTHDQDLMVPPLLLEEGVKPGFSVYAEITTPEGVTFHGGVNLPADAALGDIARALKSAAMAAAACHGGMLPAMVADRMGGPAR